MKLRQNYPYNEALDDFERFIEKYISHQDVKDEFNETISYARKKKTVPMKGLHDRLMKYRKQHQAYTSFTAEEREMMDDLMHFWG